MSDPDRPDQDMGDTERLLVCRIGQAAIYSIPEVAARPYAAKMFFPDLDPTVLSAHSEWLAPWSYDRSTGQILVGFQAFLIKLPNKLIIIDPPYGNHKQRPRLTRWHMLDLPFLDRLGQCGVREQDIALVVSTHLHADHVGWNTRLSQDRWIPTFPNSRYVMQQGELDRIFGELRADPNLVAEEGSFDDSVRPIISANLADFVATDATIISDGDYVLRYEAAFGHTSGHCQLVLSGPGGTAIFCGDVLHHPVEIVDPEIRPAFDQMPAKAVETRALLLDRCEKEGAWLVPAHFAFPVAGRIVSPPGGRRYQLFRDTPPEALSG